MIILAVALDTMIGEFNSVFCVHYCVRVQVPEGAEHLFRHPTDLDRNAGPSTILWNSSCHWILDENPYDFLMNGEPHNIPYCRRVDICRV